MRSFLFAAVAAAIAPSTFAQEILLREDDPSPTGNAGEIVEFINAVAVSPNGAYGVVFQTDDGTTDVSRIWGSFTGGAPSILRSETTIGTLTQNNFEFAFGINDSTVGYSAISDDSSGATGLDGIWAGDTPVILEDQPVPSSPGEFWVFGSRPGITTSGEVTGVAGITDMVGGSTQKRALVRGTTIIHQTGDLVPGAPAPLSSFLDFDSWFSPDGTEVLALLDLDGAPSAEDAFLALNGTALELGGTLVREDNIVPVSVGGDGVETWDNFDYLQINDNGDYVFTGDTGNSATDADEFVVRNGTMVLREGDVVDGETLFAGVLGCSLNNNGDLALVWKAVGDTEILIYNGEIILREGDMIDWDGDGTPEPTSLLTDFTGSTRAIALTDDGKIFFTADVDVNGTVLEGFFCIDTNGGGIGTPFCSAAIPNSTGAVGTLTGSGSTAVVDNDVTLTAGSLPVGQFGIFVVSTQAGMGTAVINGGILCLEGQIGRFTQPGQVLQADANGEFSLALDLNMIPTPNAFVAVNPGDTLFFQAWHRDGTVTMPSSNFTTGLQIDFN